MFDVGFFELLMVGLVTLLVVGPERLPTVARTAGKWIGRGRRILLSVKADIEQELRAEELKRILKEQAGSTPVHEILEEGRESLESVRKEAESVVKEAAVREPADAASARKSDSNPHAR